MNNIQETFSDYFHKLYAKEGYLDKYGGSVVATALTLFVFFLIFSWYYVQERIQPIKQDWVNQRCSPSVMAFAGWINKTKPEQTAFESTSENFMQCTTQILASVVSYFMQPYYFITGLIAKIVNVLQKAVNAIRAFLNYLRTQMNKMFGIVIGRIVNVMVPLRIILTKLKDTMQKTIGVAVTGLYTVYGAYLGLKAFIGSFLMICIIALIVLVALIIILWIMPWTWPVAAATTVFFLLIAIPIAIIAGWMIHILNISSRRVPNKPGCFDKDTLIETTKGPIKISNLKTGTELKNGDIVTATFKLAYDNLDVYDLEGITVTGCHKVFHDNLGWIYVKDHPSSIKMNNYRKPTIYCISTLTKRINIGKYKFLDWDDLEPLDIIKLKNLHYLDNNSSMADIHKNLESGLDGNIMIELESGNSVKLKNIQVNDQLYSGERVTGIVKIETKNIYAVKKYKFKNFEIIGAPNIHFKDVDLGNFNTLKLQADEVEKPSRLYHILTDTGFFNIDGHKLRDYNSAIENILDIRDKLFALF
tara:strand:- start:1510 stop:3102 length:1593 start_codon:yes stop_codon:yes gene_type:complete